MNVQAKITPANSPNTSTGSSLDGQAIQGMVIESAVRIGLLVVLVLTCLAIVKPFITLILWGAILAVAFNPIIEKLTVSLDGKQKLASTLFTLVLLAGLLIPTIIIASSSFETAGNTVEQIEAGTLKVPPPTKSVSEWPIIGKPIYKLWAASSHNLEAVMAKYKKEVAATAAWLLGTLGSTLGGILQFAFSIVIAGVFLATSKSCSHGLARLSTRFFGEQGERFIGLTTGTIRSVAQGVVGIAIIQALLSAVGLFVAGVPMAGIWAVLVLLLAIMQLPPIIGLVPGILYMFSSTSTTAAVIFLVWSIFAGSCDTFLKPLLLGRGVEVPMLVILLGAIGGMMFAGIIGLFVGSVVLALGYQLFVEWIDRGLES